MLWLHSILKDTENMTGIILKENSGILIQHKQNDTKNTQNKQQQQ